MLLTPTISESKVKYFILYHYFIYTHIFLDVAYDINAAGDDYDDADFDSDCDHHHHDGLLGRLLKREEAVAGTVRIARKNTGNKMMNNKSAKKAAAAAAAAKMA